MPTYEYECNRCGHRFERFQSITDRPLQRCPECRGKIKRLIGTGAGIIFKGSGFYETDYRSESYKQAQKRDTPKPAAAGKNGDSKTKSAKKDTSGAGTKKKEG